MTENNKNHTTIEHDEFKLLFQYNMFSMLGIFSAENPMRKLSKMGRYDTASEIREKISTIFDTARPSPPPPHEYYINLNLQKEVNTLTDLEKYVTELERKIQNYKIAMVAGETVEQSIDKFLLRVMGFMSKRGFETYAADVVETVALLSRTAEFKADERNNFYRALANSKLGKQRFYDMLSNTCTEFLKSQNTDVDFISRAKCECPYSESDSCEKYPRRSLALHYAMQQIKEMRPSENNVLALSVDRCVASGASFHYWIQKIN
jgi:hypothetical protein